MILTSRKFLVFFIFISLLILTACQSGRADKNEINKRQGNNTLKLYANSEIFSDSTLINKAINTFQESNSGVEFIVDNIEKLEGYSMRLSTELMAGEGPDVLLLNNYLDLPLYKIMKSEALQNLDEYIKDDKQFNINDYNKAVMDSGVYNGERFLLPISYRVSSFITTESLLTNNDFHINPDNWTLGNLAEQVSRLKDRQSGNGRCNYSFRGVLFRDCFGNFEHKYIDYGKGKVSLNTDEFVGILNNFKALQDSGITHDDLLKYASNTYNIMKDNKMLAYDSDDLIGPKNLWTESNNIKYYLESEAKLYPPPTEDGSKRYSAEPEIMLAMNQNCRNKQLAYSFIKTFLTESFQIFETENGIPVPVNKKAYEKLLSQYAGEQGTGKDIELFDGTKHTSEPLTPALIKDVHNIVDNIAVCDIYDSNIMNIIYDELRKFLKGNCTAEDAAEQMERKIQLYLNE